MKNDRHQTSWLISGWRRTRVRLASAGRASGCAVAVAAVTITAACSSAASGTSSSAHQLTVGVIETAQATLFDTIVASFEQQMRHDLPGWQITFQVQNTQGDPSLTEVIARQDAESQDGMFALLGTSAVIALAKLDKQRPIIAIAMSDPVGAKVAASLQHPGGNVTGSTDFIDPRLILPRLLEISRPRRIGTIYDPAEQNMQLWIRELQAAAASAHVSLAEATVASPADITAAARSLVGRADAVLIGPDGTVFAALAGIGAIALQNKLPMYTIGGDPAITGTLASLGPNYSVVGQLAGQVAARVARGAAPGDVPFAEPQGVLVQANQATARSLGITVTARGPA
jgi:putative ABC transport system substrate-binding protein